MLRWLAEQRIQEAMDRGEFDDYKGKGEPFPEEFFSDNPFVRGKSDSILDLKGFMPHELMLKREIEILKVKIKSKKISPEERTKLMHEMSIKEVEFQARIEFLKD